MKVIIQLIRKCLHLLGESKGISKAHIIQNRLCISKKQSTFEPHFIFISGDYFY